MGKVSYHTMEIIKSIWVSPSRKKRKSTKVQKRVALILSSVKQIIQRTADDCYAV